MLKQVGVKKDISLIKKYIEKVKNKTPREEILTLSRILATGPKEIRSPAQAYMIISNYISTNKLSEDFIKVLKKAQNKIQFRIVDCKILVKNENTDAARLACSRIEDSNNPDVLISLSKIYSNNKSIFLNVNKKINVILKKSIVLGNSEALNMLSYLYEEREENLEFLMYLTSLKDDKSILSNLRNLVKSQLKKENLKIMSNLKDNSSGKGVIFQSISKNNCDLLTKLVDYSDIKLLNEAASKINFKVVNCDNNSALKLLLAVKSTNISDTFNSYKKLCSRKIKNSCLLLGNMYLNNNLPSRMNSYDKEDRIELGIDNYQKSVDQGNVKAMVPLADVLLANNRKVDKAKLILQNAIDQGEIDGLYIKARYEIKKTFFSGKETCKPLLKFLSNDVTDSIYYEQAIKLNKDKCR